MGAGKRAAAAMHAYVMNGTDPEPKT